MRLAPWLGCVSGGRCGTGRRLSSALESEPLGAVVGADSPHSQGWGRQGCHADAGNAFVKLWSSELRPLVTNSGHVHAPVFPSADKAAPICIPELADGRGRTLQSSAALREAFEGPG